MLVAEGGPLLRAQLLERRGHVLKVGKADLNRTEREGKQRGDKRTGVRGRGRREGQGNVAEVKLRMLRATKTHLKKADIQGIRRGGKEGKRRDVQLSSSMSMLSKRGRPTCERGKGGRRYKGGGTEEGNPERVTKSADG